MHLRVNCIIQAHFSNLDETTIIACKAIGYNDQDNCRGNATQLVAHVYTHLLVYSKNEEVRAVILRGISKNS